jgi:hypothetical protein
MARGDIKILNGSGAANVPTATFKTEANATAILAGEPLKLKSAGSPYAIPCADADLTVGTDTVFLGVAKTDSTQTASADGEVEVYLPLPGVIYEMKATTAANVDTQAEIDALLMDRVTLDLADGVYTLDENDGDNAANAFYIIGGDPVSGRLKFMIRHGATYLSL